MTEPAPTAPSPIPSVAAGATAAPDSGAAVRPVLRPIPRWVIAVGMPVMILIAAAAVWLLLGRGVGKDQLDAIRTGGTLGVGLGGVVALWLAVRKQRSTELDLLQKYDTHELAQEIAQDARDDVIARRITDLYRQGVDQLGSDKAPVRLGGLYALERLAQDNPDPRLRQTTVNVLCAYLRMPYTEPPTAVHRSRPLERRRPVRIGKPLPPLPQPAEPARSSRGNDVSSRQESEVRLTAQRILQDHLKPGLDRENPVTTFWPDINLDLTGAALSNLNLTDCHLNNARLDYAELAGSAWFDRAEFAGDVGFEGAEVAGDARFESATFAGNAAFQGAEVAGDARFENATFAGNAAFQGAEVAGDARFENVTFARNARFENATFTGNARFDGAEVAGRVWFENATFAGNARFENATFAGNAEFQSAEFAGNASFEGAWVKVAGDDKWVRRFWPAGWATANQPVPREGKPGLWVPLAASDPAQTKTNDQ